MPEEKDGILKINIAKNSTDPLGVKLSYSKHDVFDTAAFGKVVGMPRASMFISTKDFPRHLLSVKSMSDEVYKGLRNLEKVKRDNYWGIMAYFASEKVKLYAKAIKGSKRKIVLCEEKADKKQLFGKEIEVPVFEEGKYIEILRKYVELIQADEFTDENIVAVIKSYKNVPGKKLLEDFGIDIDI